MADLNESSTAIPAVPADPPAAAPPAERRSQWFTWLEILLCSGYPTQLTIMFVLLTLGMRPVLDDQQLSANFIFTLTLVDTVFLLSLIVYLLVRRGESPRQVFFGERPAAGEVGVGLLSLPVVIALVVGLMMIILRVVPTLRNVPQNPLEAFLGTQTGLAMFLFVVVVGGGVREELQRAFLLHRFRADLGQPWIGLLFTSLAFGMGHTLQGYDAAIVTGSLGALWGAIYLLRRSAIGPIVSHSLFNSFELIRVFLR